MSVNTKEPQSQRRIGYARVSTSSQTTDQQVHALEETGCSEVFIDEGVSATARIRPGLLHAKEALCEGDVFVVWAIDRAFRSTIEAILFLDELMGQGIAFQSLTQHIDTRTPEGRKWFIDTASWAEYERELISRRTKEKMADARRKGQHLGPPFKLSRRRILNAHRMIVKDALPIEDVAARYDVAPITLIRGFKRHGLAGSV